MRSFAFTLSTADPGRLFSNVLPWLLAILGLAVVGAVVIMLVRRALRSDSSRDAPGFTLQSLREMRDQGQITEEEYERAREAMIGRVKRDAEQSKPTEQKPNASTPGETRQEDAPDSDKPAD